jgi:hypothetical protein
MSFFLVHPDKYNQTALLILVEYQASTPCPILHSLIVLPFTATFYFLYHDATASVCQGVLIVEASRSDSDIPQSVGLLWTSDQLVAETCN